MFLRGCFPDVYKKLGTAPSALMNLDTNLISKANSYFVDSVYVPAKILEQQQKALSLKSGGSSSLNIFNCKNCHSKFDEMSELIKHQRESHELKFVTSFDSYNQLENENKNNCSNSPIGKNSPIHPNFFLPRIG